MDEGCAQQISNTFQQKLDSQQERLYLLVNKLETMEDHKKLMDGMNDKITYMMNKMNEMMAMQNDKQTNNDVSISTMMDQFIMLQQKLDKMHPCDDTDKKLKTEK
eukprot:773208_1